MTVSESGDVTASASGEPLRVLQLYTSTRSFFENQLTALERQGVEVTRLRVPGSYEPDAPRSATDYARYVPAVLRESMGEYDLVHANHGLVAPFALAQPVRPVVVTLWGSDLMGERGWLRKLSRFGATHADAVVLPSERMVDGLDDVDEPTIVPFGIDTDLFRPIPRDEARAEVGWDRDGRYALFPYRPERPEKDFERARRIVDRADVELKQVDGVDHDAMPYYYSASDALLLTSQRESGPMAVKEAAACNVPVVSTDVGFVDRVLDGVDRSVVSDADAELVAGLESVAETGARSDGRTVLDGLGIDEMGAHLVDVYRRALADRDAAGSKRVTPSTN